MDGIFGHNFKIALPLIIAFLAVPALLLAAQSLWQIATLTTVPGTTGAFIGDGIDSFAYLMAPLTGTLLQAITDNGGILTIIALVATAMSVVEAVRRLLIALRGPGDSGRLMAYGASRSRALLVANPVHPWGTVRDATSGDALALARVTLVNAHGRPLASAITDARGWYGFTLAADALPGGHALSVTKSGYYGVPNFQPTLSSVGRQSLDIALHPSRIT
ncbi:MAG TPA: carboxypeptidase-like regulatory domain-containing protein, partial [Candidatus Paceibacterota bacterium]|nr:carboxypeptidase-like regulatory domain-containing protein [Candidatus Paceibacterota bacterium]